MAGQNPKKPKLIKKKPAAKKPAPAKKPAAKAKPPVKKPAGKAVVKAKSKALAKTKPAAPRKTPRDLSTEKKLEIFISELRVNGGLILSACEAAKVHPSTVYDHFDKDLVFRDLWLTAIAYSDEEIEREQRKRAGLGKAGKAYKNKSDTMLIALANKSERRVRIKQKFKEIGEAALRGVQDAVQSAGITQDQVNAIQDAILARYKKVSATL